MLPHLPNLTMAAHQVKAGISLTDTGLGWINYRHCDSIGPASQPASLSPGEPKKTRVTKL